MHKKLLECLCCGGTNLVKVLDLNDQPLANSYLKSKDEEENLYPLAINFCVDCTHIQLTDAVDPDLLFKDYLYVSGTTKTLKDYFDWFVTFTEGYNDGKNVLDIACNDGTQLDSFKNREYNTFGIDPASNLYPISSNNHSVICDYFNRGSISAFQQKFDKIIAQNVFAHNSDPLQFLLDCHDILEDGGFVFIQTSQADMVKNNQFDTIYHEHISFFSVKSMNELAKRAGFNLFDVVRTPVHGTSFVFVLCKHRSSNADELIANEIPLTLDVMRNYADRADDNAITTKVFVDLLKEADHVVVGYGAAAKGNTFINYSKFTLDYIVDDNPLKHNLYSPGSKIPIYSPEKLLEQKDLLDIWSKKLVIVPLAWNFFDEIKAKVEGMGIKDARYLRYFPVVRLV